MKFFVNLFRPYPVCAGLLCLIIISYLITPKELREPFLVMPSTLLPVFFFYAMAMLFYMLFILQKIEREKREKATWIIVAIAIVISTIIMKIYLM